METVKKFFKKIDDNLKEAKKEIRSIINDMKKEKNEANFNISVAKIDTFCDNLERNICNDGKIIVFGDYDVDGIFSTSMMLLMIREYAYNLYKNNIIEYDKYKNFITNNVKFIIPNRSQGYGLNEKTLSVLLKNFNYIVTCDNGTQDSIINYVTHKDNINKIFVLDHHYNGDFRKNLNIINPNSDGQTEISTGILIYRFIEKINKRKSFELDTMSDLATFTFISDVANLNSHRDILNKGLAQINNAEFLAKKNVEKMINLKAEIKELAQNNEKEKAIRKVDKIQKIKENIAELEALSLNRRKFITRLISSSDNADFTTVKHLQFNIIPKLNAVNRMTDDSSFLVQALINNNKEDKYYDDIIYQLNYINTQRKKITKEVTKEALNYIQKNNLTQDDFIFIQIADNLNGIAGLVAQKIHDFTNADVIVASLNSKEELTFSGRGLNIYKQLDILSRNTNEYEKIFKFGGHLVALGGNINNLNAFKELIQRTKNENKFLEKIHDKKILLQQENIILDKFLTLEKYEELSKYLSEKTNNIPYDKKILANVIVTADMIENKSSVLSKIPNSDFVSLKLKMDYLDENKNSTEVRMILNSKDANELLSKCMEYEEKKSTLIPTFFVELNNHYIENEKNIFGGIVAFNNAVSVDTIISEKNNIKNNRSLKV